MMQHSTIISLPLDLAKVHMEQNRPCLHPILILTSGRIDACVSYNSAQYIPPSSPPLGDRFIARMSYFNTWVAINPRRVVKDTPAGRLPHSLPNRKMPFTGLPLSLYSQLNLSVGCLSPYKSANPHATPIRASKQFCVHCERRVGIR